MNKKIFTIENATTRLTIDEGCRLHELTNLVTGHNYAGGEAVWRLYYIHGQRFQNEIVSCQATPVIVEKPGGLDFDYDHLPSRDGDLAIRLHIEVRLSSGACVWSANIRNDSSLVVKEFQFPLVASLRLVDGQALITSEFGGQRYDDPFAFARSGARGPYCDEDYLGIMRLNAWPGYSAASNCFLYANDNEGLYFANYDQQFRNTIHMWRILGNNLESGFAKHLFLQPGCSVDLETYEISPYAGTWHVAADRYRYWVDNWARPEKKPQWVTQMTGWQRLIMKHQNGEMLFAYDSLPKIHADGMKSGINSLFMFGWWPGGMDRMYPDYVCDPELGGEDVLKKNIKLFQDELGGNVILYANGRLADRESAWFRERGDSCVIRSRSGAEARDNYLFSNRSTYERLYGAVELSPICLSSEEWIGILEKVIDRAVELGCRGVFFDQLGLLEPLCWNPEHGHSVPSIDQTANKRIVMRHLRDYARAKDPDLAFGIEIFNDAVGEYSDFVHGLYCETLSPRNRDWEEKMERPLYTCFIDWMRYTYPEIIISDRDIRDGNDIERRVNHALLKGLIHDVEIYRCRRTIAEIPHYQEYLGKINRLRERFGDLLLRGTYRDQLGFSQDNPEVDARAFQNGGRMAVVLCQSHMAEATVRLDVPGHEMLGHDGVGRTRVTDHGDHQAIVLGKHGLAVIEFCKASSPKKS